MRKTLSLFALAGIVGLTSISLEAKKLTPQEALDRATTTSQVPRKMKAKKASMKLAKTVMSEKSNEEAVYVFDNSNDGFVVVPADDMFPAVLGYSDRGSVATGDVPPAFTWWIEQYAAQIEAVRENGLDPESEAQGSEERPAIEPLVKSKWDQDAPYSNKVPRLTSSSSSARSATGCVATAMAQIMYYYKYPAVGTGEISYEYTRDNNTTNKLSEDLSTMPFDWDNMLDEYNAGEYTTEQGDAVATLMYACGLAVDMKYGKSSDANTVKDVKALCENFGYSKEMRYWYREYMTSQEWEDVVYSSLSRQRPVVYSGASDSGGHSFVCDGYSGDGYYHINWGWAGLSDGYFLLNLMNPSDQGTGGTGSGYNERQLIITDIHPAEEGETFEYQTGLWGYKGDFSYGVYPTNGTANSFFILDHGTVTGVYNKSPHNIQFYYGLKAVDSEGVEHLIYSSSHKDYKYGSGLKRFSLDPSDLEDGEYRVSLIYLLDSEETPRLAQHENGYTHELIMKVKNGAWVEGVAAPKEPADYPDMIVTAFNTVGSIYRNEAHNYTFSVTNLSKTRDYAGDIHLDVLNASGESVYNLPFKQNLNKAQTITYSFACSLDLEPGDYTVRFTNPAGVPLSNVTYPMTIAEGNVEGIDGDLEFVSFTPTELEPYTQPEKIYLKAVNVSGSTLKSFKLRRSLYNIDGTEIFSTVNSWSFSWSNNSSQILSLSACEDMALAPGEYYTIFELQKTDAEGNVTYQQVTPKIYINVRYTVDDVTFDKESLVVKAGETEIITVSINPDVASEVALRWHSENPEVATVDENGVVTGVTPGETDIYAMAPNGCFAIAHVTVLESTEINTIMSEGLCVSSTKNGFDVRGVTGETIVHVYSTTGEQVMPAMTISEDATVSLDELVSGIYIVTAVSDGKTATLKLNKR